jgi:hypothetical protein
VILTLESVKEAGQNGATSTSAMEQRCHRRVLAARGYQSERLESTPEQSLEFPESGHRRGSPLPQRNN